MRDEQALVAWTRTVSTGGRQYAARVFVPAAGKYEWHVEKAGDDGKGPGARSSPGARRQRARRRGMRRGKS